MCRTRCTSQWRAGRDGWWFIHLLDFTRFVILLTVKEAELTYSFADQVKAGTVNESDIDAAVKTMLRTKFALGLFESELHIHSMHSLCNYNILICRDIL